jgi:hypothetical protein
MTTKYQIITAVSLVVLAFAFGRYSVTKDASKQVTTQTHEQVDTQVQKDKDVHTITTTTTEKAEDGSQITKTVVDQTSVAHTAEEQEATIDTKKQVITTSAPRTTVSGLAGIDFHTKQPTYGAMVQRQLIGPISVGVWGLSNLSGGISVGVSF